MISIIITIFMGKSGNETDLTACVVYTGVLHNIVALQIS